ncbi:fibrinogen-like protein 1 [Esox lucius]|uniref:Fibrinogen C-terminal domain-containing protein n=1 Tax=Esox lucius TaxID=8010 RepID=A0A3P9AE03_ESOLU|nr:fibrinogen-like protein 1 [Esox lucius]
MTSLVLLLALVLCQTLASPHLSVSDPCVLELEELRRDVRILENKLLIGAWQLTHLKTHSFIHLPQSSTNLTESFKTGVLDTLPPAGSLTVYDRDCSELFERLRPASGFYRIRPRVDQEPVLAFCDMEDGGGWTVLQRRRHGRVDFNRDWVDYRDGFGDFKLWNDEFWLGNEHIHSLVKDGENLVKIDLMDWGGQRRHVYYQNFKIADEKDSYRLFYGLYSGDGGDALSGGTGMLEQWSDSLSGMPFSTRDQDHDRYLQGNCAQENRGGWWYNRCHAANLNGKFYRGGPYQGRYDNGVVWGTWRGLWYSLRHTSIKLRPLLTLDRVAGSGAGPDG